MDHFFPELLGGVRYLFEKCTLRFGPKNFVHFCEIDWILTALNPGIRNLIAPNSSIKHQNPSHDFLRLFVGLTVNLFVPKYALSAEFSSRI